MRWQQKKLCCFYVSTLMSHVVVVGYGKGVLETGFQLCQTMMLCTSVCVCVCVLARSFTCAHSLSLHRSPVLLLFFFLFFCARLHRLLLSHTHIYTYTHRYSQLDFNGSAHSYTMANNN